MTTLATVLNGATILSASTAPSMGTINTYNATGGALTPTLQALSGTNVGASFIIEKHVADTSFNTITLSTNSGDYFDDGRTSLVLYCPGDRYQVQCESVSGTKYWKVLNLSNYRVGLLARVTEFSLNTSNSLTTINTLSLPVGFTSGQGVSAQGYLTTGAHFRITMQGSIQTTSTSGTLTFTPSLQNTALNTGVMPSVTSANAASGFWCQTDITVRSTGTTGTAIAKTFGVVNLATTGVTCIASTATTATTINTTSTASSTVLMMQAQWATNNASNALLVENCVFERVI